MSLQKIRQLITPPLATAGIPGIGGTLRNEPEDFHVREIARLRPGSAHVALLLWKRSWATEDAVSEIARQLEIPPREIGYAGLKDKNAVTEQWLSSPARYRDRIPHFEHRDLRVCELRPCGRKLKPGDHAGNDFEITIRGIALEPAEALARVEYKLARLREIGGIPNFFGPQAFDRSGKLALRGLSALSGGDQDAAGDIRAARQAQAVLFHSYLLDRMARGLSRTVHAGDRLTLPGARLTFICREPSTDQDRLDAGEIWITGPLFGHKMEQWPTSGSVPDSIEHDTLARFNITSSSIAERMPLPGSRRSLQIATPEVSVVPVNNKTASLPLCEASPLTLRLSFRLPSGAYATVLLRELQD